MPKNALKIDADSESEWFGWPQKKVLPNGETVRPLTGGECRVLEIDGNRAQKSFVALQFTEDLAPGDVKNIRAKWDGRTVEAFFNPVFPRFALLCPTTLAEGNAYSFIRLELEYSVGRSNTSKPSLQISAVYYLPARGMFSKQWASRQRQAVAKKAGGKPEWSPEDFPYSHFDGLAFMLNNELVRKSIQEAEFASAIEYFLKNESQLKTSLILAVDTSPQPGNLSNILGHALQVPDLKKTILNQKNELCRTQDQLNLERAKSRLEINQTSAQKRNIEEENKLLLKQLHSVQEELEKVFIESEKFKSHLAEHDIIQNELQKTLLECSRKNKEIQTLSAECKELKNRTLEFEKKKSELVIQGQKSVTEREALQKDLAAAVQGTAETEKKRAELAAQLDARTKEREALNTENKALVFEREALKKDLAAAMQGTTETEKKWAELAAQLDTRTKERDEQTKLAIHLQSSLEETVKEKNEEAKLASERQSALEAASKESDQLKKTAGDRAARIAELEAQVADQAQRQKLIDEQMVRAESQLEMLKQFLQPAFQ